MKIHKFNEKLSDDVEEYIDNFEGSADYSILNWISEVSHKTKLKEYKFSDVDDETLSIKKIESFITNKNFNNLLKLYNINSKIIKLNKEIEKLEKYQDKIKKDAANEVLYKFQEELLEKDIDSFYNLFIEDRMEDGEIDYGDIHPSILKKYRKNIDAIIAGKKFNL